MPITFKEYREHGYVISEHAGLITDQEFLEAYRNYYESSNWMGELNELADLSEVDYSEISTDAFVKLNKYTEDYCKKHGIDVFYTAVYAPHDLPYGLARVYQSWSEESPEYLHVFRDLNDAKAWLIANKKD